MATAPDWLLYRQYIVAAVQGLLQAGSLLACIPVEDPQTSSSGVGVPLALEVDSDDPYRGAGVDAKRPFSWVWLGLCPAASSVLGLPRLAGGAEVVDPPLLKVGGLVVGPLSHRGTGGVGSGGPLTAKYVGRLCWRSLA